MMRTKRGTVKNIGARTNIPAWLANPDALAPCMCGMPLLPGQPYIVGEGELGMKRWFHGACWAMLEDDDEDEDEDEDDEA